MTAIPLPENPPGCTVPPDSDVERLRKFNSGMWANPNKTCITCAKAGPFKSRVGTEIVTYDCNCVEQWKLYLWMLNAGIDKNYQRLSWHDVVAVDATAQMKVLEYILSATQNINHGLGMTFGSPDRGTGKTLLAALTLKALMAEGHSGFFIQFNEMLDAFSAGWRDADERAWFIRRVRNAGVLVIDDIGREYKGRGEMVEATFDSVIRTRVGGDMPTIITTNLTEDQLLQGYGPNVLSLLTEVNEYIHFPGSDYRTTARTKKTQDIRDGIIAPLTAPRVV